MIKRDIHNHEERYKSWKSEFLNSKGEVNKKYVIGDLTKKNSNILIRYILDMENGINISNKNVKGGRSYPRLNTIRGKIKQVMEMLQERGIKDITQVTEEKLIRLFSDMEKGVIKTAKGEKYKSWVDYVKITKAFWRWWIKVNKKQGIQILDITEDLSTKRETQPNFVYIKKDQMEKALPYFEEQEQIVQMFCFDSLIRSPTELLSLRVQDIYKEDKEIWVNIPDNISKTFGRKFNLLYCGDALMKYIKDKNLEPNDYLFNFSYPVFTKKLQKVYTQLYGDRVSDTRAGGKWSEITLYDYRHSGAISLRILASRNGKISLDAIRQRGGWTDFKMLNYYTKFLGLDGHIKKGELTIQEDKTELEKGFEELKKRLQALEKQRYQELKNINQNV